MRPAETPRVKVGPFHVVDLERDHVVSLIAELAGANEARLASHLHVGSLNFWHDEPFVEAMNASDVVYADGMATVLIAKAAGSRRIQRAGLTDIGEEVLGAVRDGLERQVRVALVGGPDGLAARAGDVLADRQGIDVVYTDHGYHDGDRWDRVLERLRAASPDVVFIGLGMPAEAHWAQRHRRALPPSLVLAAGGYFGHLVGDERRAPVWAQKAGLEWVWRVAHDRKKLKRYAQGFATTTRMTLRSLRSSNE